MNGNNSLVCSECRERLFVNQLFILTYSISPEVWVRKAMSHTRYIHSCCRVWCFLPCWNMLNAFALLISLVFVCFFGFATWLTAEPCPGFKWAEASTQAASCPTTVAHGVDWPLDNDPRNRFTLQLSFCIKVCHFHLIKNRIYRGTRKTHQISTRPGSDI